MYISLKFCSYIVIITLLLYFIIYFYFFNHLNTSMLYLTKKGSLKTFNKFLFKNLKNNDIIFNAQCKCHPDLVLKKTNTFYDVSYANFSYQLSKDEFDNSIFTCDFAKTLRRNKHQKVLSYSLYGKNIFYYNLLKNLSLTIKQIYPTWIMRIYYDDTIDMSVICDIECLKDNKNNFIDNVDFCNVNNLPIKHKKAKLWSLSDLHAMMWRWLPIGDSFVDVFSSRDSDSLIIQREIDSVNVWINSSKIGHLMRDNKGHGSRIMGGMWGFFNQRNRSLGVHILNLIINSKSYNKPKNLKGVDQMFLENIYWIFKDISIIHDSFYCDSLGGEPFPTKRIGNCFIGSAVNCDIKATLFDICPLKCRPKDHLDWIHC